MNTAQRSVARFRDGKSTVRAGRTWMVVGTLLLGGLASLYLIALGVLVMLWGYSFASFDGVEQGFPWAPLGLVGVGIAVGVATGLAVRWLRRGSKARRASSEHAD